MTTMLGSVCLGMLGSACLVLLGCEPGVGPPAAEPTVTTPAPASGSAKPTSSAARAAAAAIDPAAVEAATGNNPETADGIVKVSYPRTDVKVEVDGWSMPPFMGLTSWAGSGADDNAVVDGDFAVTEDELQPVLKSLRGSGINVAAIHHHMVGETPRILFLRSRGRGPAPGLATAVKKAIDPTKVGS